MSKNGIILKIIGLGVNFTYKFEVRYFKTKLVRDVLQ